MKRMLPLLTFLVVAATVNAGDWSNWRGPEQTGISRETALPDKWWPMGENLVWMTDFGGRTTPIVQKGRVYIINKIGEDITQQERVMGLDEQTGKVLWEHKFNVFHSDIVADRLGWTNMVGD